MSKARSTQLDIAADTSMERLVASQLSRVLVLAPPWAVGILAVITGTAFHLAWPGNFAAAAGIGAAGTLLAALTWRVAHHRGTLGRWHAAGSAFAIAVWLAVTTTDGISGPLTSYATIVGGATLAVSWNIRAVIRSRGRDDADHLERAFTDATDKAGLGGSRLQIRSRTAKVISGVLALPPGEHVADDAVKRAPRLESGLRFPPGSLSIAPDLDRADRALVRISDPRVMRKPVRWPGPSAPGKSVALPLNVGIWQDSEPAAIALPGTHLMIMGMSGSGKSVGAGWSMLAELITRPDCAVLGIDITKGLQSLGPVKDALHKLATTKERARAILAAVHAAIRPRTDYLAERGMQAWEEGCGLQFVVVWLEEAPDVIDALGDKGRERWLSALKAARSAGIFYLISLQRGDWSQLPTLARGQLSKMCFGVAEASDGAFGLTELQQDRGCRPELWANGQPGMCYADLPSVPDDRKAMPMRTFWFGRDDKLIAEHAAKWPASARPLDELTASVLAGADQGAVGFGGLSEPDEDDDLDDDDELAGAELVAQIAPPEQPGDDEEPPDEIEVPDDEFGRWQFGKPPAEKADPADARQALADLVAGWRENGRKAFGIRDLTDFRASIGLSRGWLYRAVDELADAGTIERDDSGKSRRWLLS